MAQSISNLKVGDKVKFTRYGLEGSPIEEAIRLVAGHNHYRDDLNPNIVDHVTLIPWKIQDLRGFDAKEPNNSDSNRKTNGNNRYKDSNIRQWLNKSGKPWFEKTHTADEPPTDAGMSEPTGYDDIEGYLSFLTEEELNALVPTNIRVAKNTVTDGGGTEVVKDLFFLPSVTEVELANEPGGAEGSLLPLFSDDASRKAYLTQQCFDNTKSGSKPSTINDAWYYWLRTPNSSNSYGVRIVDTSGALGYNNAYYGSNGVRPLCNLKSDILVSDTTDTDGCYTIIWTNVISKDLQKINNTDFTWTVETIGEHTNVKSQLHIYSEEGNLVSQGSVQSGIGIKTDTIIPTSAGTFKAKVKLWSDVTQENWSNEITYVIDVLPYKIALDKPITIQAGEKLEKIKFVPRINGTEMTLKTTDKEKLVYAAENLNTDTADLEIEGEDAKIDNIAYVID